jgi:hypothetical protein
MLIPWPEEELKLARAGRRQGSTCERTNHVPSIVLLCAASRSGGQEVSNAPIRLPDLTVGAQLTEGGDFPRTVITLSSQSLKKSLLTGNSFLKMTVNWDVAPCGLVDTD